MSKRRKSWREKLADDKGFPQVYPIDNRKRRSWGEGTFVIPAPREVDELMRRVPEGKLTTINELRVVLARRHRATIACPITTGIFAWIAAHAAAEAEAEGAQQITPFWRTLKSGGELNPKYPGGIEALRERILNEGHQVVERKKRWFVPEFEQRQVVWEEAVDFDAGI
jgi:hypothetical protein